MSQTAEKGTPGRPWIVIRYVFPLSRVSTSSVMKLRDTCNNHFILVVADPYMSRKSSSCVLPYETLQ